MYIKTTTFKISDRSLITKMESRVVMNEEHSIKTTDDGGNEHIPFDAKKSFGKVLKRGIYKQLYDKKMISDSQLNILLQNEVM